MKNRLSYYPSRWTLVLFLSSVCIAFVFIVANTGNPFEHSFTQISKDPEKVSEPNWDKSQSSNELETKIDVLAKIVNIEQNEKEQRINDRGNNKENNTMLIENTIVKNLADSFSRTVQGENNLPGSGPYTIQGTNNSQGSVINDIPNSVVLQNQDNVIHNIPKGVPLPNHHNVMTKTPNRLSLPNHHNVMTKTPNRLSFSNYHHVFINSQNSVPLPNHHNVLTNTPNSIPLPNQRNAIHVDVPYIAGRKVPAGINGHQIGSVPGSQLSGNTNKLVLLLTYLRSGSTLTADIIQQVPRVFYAYEPLKQYVVSDIGYLSLNGICSMNNLTCRKPSLLSELPQLYIEDIVRYYGCDLNHVAGPFLWSETSVSVRKYKDCIHVTSQLNSDNQFCLHQCFDSTRYLKTIRLSMDIVEILMKIIPKLKVVHLLRDPRGMIQSQKRGGFVKPWMDLTTVARSVCQRFERDIEIAMKLKKKYPGRLKTYLYEQIAEHPKQTSENLFSFLGLTASDSFDSWLHNHTAAGTNGKYYGTTRANSSLTASLWRLRMPYNDVLKVDTECENFYKYTGILKAVSNESLRDLNFHLRLPSPESEIFL